MVVLFTMIVGSRITAQTSGNNSPYSRYGIGTLSDGSQSFNKGMSGLSQGMRGLTVVNWQNPASYAAVDSLTLLFDIGASFTTAHMTYNGSSVNPQNSLLDYVQAAFHIMKNVGVSFGLRPYSVIGYNFTSSKMMEDIDGYGEKVQTASYLGEGGTHVVYGGLGWAPFKNFSLGANVSYLFGNYTHSSTVSFSETTIQSLSRKYMGDINTWLLDLGTQYACKLNNKNKLTLGVTVGVGHKINESAMFINQKLLSTSVIGADTTHVKDAYQIPWSVSAGFAVTHNEHFTWGLDYICQMWKNCRFPEFDNVNGTQVYQVGKNSLSNLQKIIIGGEYEGNPEGLRFRDHVSYQFGASYATPYYKVNNQNGPKSYTLSLGIGLPIINQYSNRSVLKISTQYERVGGGSSMIKENYFRLCLGLSFNARWFNKWKFE